jgi:hypothetical protein
LHLIHKHQYPTYFPFDLPLTGTLTIEQRKIKEQINKKRQEKRLKQSKGKESKPPSKDTDTAMEDLSTSMAKLSLPKSISFGRRPPAIYHSTQQRSPAVQQVISEPREDQQDVETKIRKPRKRGPKKKKPKPENMDI